MVTEKRRGRVAEGKMHGVYSMIVQNVFVHKDLKIVINSNASKRNCQSKHRTSLSGGFRTPRKAS